MRFPFILQSAANDCGLTCLKMIAAYYKPHYTGDFSKQQRRLTKKGISMLGIFNAAKKIGFNCQGVKMGIEELKDKVQRGPAILHCAENHFVVVYKAPIPQRNGMFYVADPARGLKKFKEKEFKAFWIGNNLKRESSEWKKTSSVGYALLLKPLSEFYELAGKEVLSAGE